MPRRLIQFYVRHLKHSPVYVIINTLAAIAFAVLFTWVYSQNTTLHKQDRETKALALSNRNLTKQNINLLKKVQNNRRDLIWKGCREQNARHNGSLAALKSLLKKSGVSQTRRSQAYQQTKILIDALVPIRNCAKLANNSVKPPR